MSRSPPHSCKVGKVGTGCCSGVSAKKSQGITIFLHVHSTLGPGRVLPSALICPEDALPGQTTGSPLHTLAGLNNICCSRGWLLRGASEPEAWTQA